MKPKTLTIYFAGPLFTMAERDFNCHLKSELDNGLSRQSITPTILLPQEHAKKIAQKRDFTARMYKYCLKTIDKADVILAVLDGPDADSGTCVELGYAYAKKKYIIGIRTDFRPSEFNGVNLMVAKSCNAVITMTAQQKAVEHLADKIVQLILKEKL